MEGTIAAVLCRRQVRVFVTQTRSAEPPPARRRWAGTGFQCPAVCTGSWACLTQAPLTLRSSEGKSGITMSGTSVGANKDLLEKCPKS